MWPVKNNYYIPKHSFSLSCSLGHKRRTYITDPYGFSLNTELIQCKTQLPTALTENRPVQQRVTSKTLQTVGIICLQRNSSRHQLHTAISHPLGSQYSTTLNVDSVIQEMFFSLSSFFYFYFF